MLDDDRRDQPAHDAASASARWSAATSYRQPGAAGEDHVDDRRDLAAAASTGASAPAGTRTSTRATATSSPTPKDPHRHAARDRRDREVDVDRARDDLRRARYYKLVARATATPSRCSSRTRRSGSAAAASSSRCGSSPATPTARTSAASPTSARTSARCCKGHCEDVGRDYDEIRKTWSPRGVHPRDRGRGRRRPARAVVLGRAVRVVDGGQPRRHARAGGREDPDLRRPRLHRLRARGAPTTPTPRR